MAEAITNRDMKRAALCYAGHGWPVVPAADFDGEKYVCVQLDCLEDGPHPIWRLWRERATTNSSTITSWYRMFSFGIALPTGVAFDVLEVPAWLAYRARAILAKEGNNTPIAVWQERGCHLFWVNTGATISPELSAAGVKVRGSGHWIPAPPTQTSLGPMQWAVDPERTGWQPAHAAVVCAALSTPTAHLSIPGDELMRYTGS